MFFSTGLSTDSEPALISLDRTGPDLMKNRNPVWCGQSTQPQAQKQWSHCVTAIKFHVSRRAYTLQRHALVIIAISHCTLVSCHRCRWLMVKRKQTGWEDTTHPGRNAGLSERSHGHISDTTVSPEIDCQMFCSCCSANLQLSFTRLSLPVCPSVSHACKPLWFSLPVSIPTPFPYPCRLSRRWFAANVPDIVCQMFTLDTTSIQEDRYISIT